MTEPKTTEKLPNDSESQITIYSKGLGVLCFNHEENRAEYGFLTVPNHPLLVSILDTQGNPPGTQPGDPPIKCCQVVQGAQNFIGSEGDIEIYEKGSSVANFSRVIDLEEVYGEGIEFKPDAQFAARLFITNGVFSTAADSHVSALLKPVNNPGTATSEVELARTIKIHLKGTNNRIVINGKELILDPSERYEVVFDNRCPQVLPTEGDFKHFFDILDNAGEVQFNLEFKNAVRLFSPVQDRELGKLLGGADEFLRSGELLLDRLTAKVDDLTEGDKDLTKGDEDPTKGDEDLQQKAAEDLRQREVVDLQQKADEHRQKADKMDEILKCFEGIRCDPAGCCSAKISGRDLHLPVPDPEPVG